MEAALGIIGLDPMHEDTSEVIRSEGDEEARRRLESLRRRHQAIRRKAQRPGARKPAARAAG